MEDIAQKIKQSIKNLFGMEVEPEVGLAPEGQEATYASNAALKLAGQLHRPPMEIAENLRDELEGCGFQVEVAKPGFLNFISSDEYFIESLGRINRGEVFSGLAKNISPDEYLNKTVIAEFSDPNPFKVLHVGHLYTSIVGDCLARLMEVAGARVIRANFGGDVGMHVAKNMYEILQRREELDKLAISEDNSGNPSSGDAQGRSAKLTRPTEELPELSNNPTKNSATALLVRRAEFMANCYVAGTRAYEEDETAHERIVQLNKKIYAIADQGENEVDEVENGDRFNAKGRIPTGQKFDPEEDFAVTPELSLKMKEIAEIYWRAREWSYAYFEDFYARIGLKFDKYYPESTVAGRGLQAVKAGLEKGIYEESDGAVVFKGEKYGLHTRVFINKEGLPTYEAKDVGLILTKWADWHFDKSVIITGNDIKDYMKVVLASIGEFEPELPERTLHLTHGNVKLAGGVKMSSRKGNFLKAVEVLDLAGDELREGYGSTDERVVLAAVKYAFLKSKVGVDTIFDPKESVSMTGNSGPYLQYAVVRGKKIIGAAELIAKSLSQWQLNSHERKLAKKVCEYEDTLRTVVRELAPQKLCGYLYELAQEFSRFYENVKVAGSEFEQERMALVAAYVAVMEHGLGLLGIEVPEEM